MKRLEVASHSPQETHRIGRALGENAQAGDVILLIGDLGTGKTTLTQGIAAGLGITTPVRSPTFVLVTQHQGRLTLYHADLYRVDRPLEALELGLEDYFQDSGVCVIEWAEKAPEAFPDQHLTVHLAHTGEETRGLVFESHGHRYEQMLSALAAELRPIPGGPGEA
ncbi:MAG: tRNA (adenosine(37)-N6)-threonylcarbamoyltransferase complex ATPase subunit type 1 TsaE [Dehalococcoidia bacterium]|nr:tRNA (adenosine(37)-N6)-threonylcarbamoyltransferase complex ATPase subunit type 1 TsaE [Dehalococcoidia bacterium]